MKLSEEQKRIKRERSKAAYWADPERNRARMRSENMTLQQIERKRASAKRYRKKHPERVKAREKRYRERNAERLRQKSKQERKLVKARCMAKYGGCCAYCGTSELRILTLDHLNDDGARERKLGGRSGSAFYRKLLKLPKRNDIQVCCWNCQERKKTSNATDWQFDVETTQDVLEGRAAS